MLRAMLSRLAPAGLAIAIGCSRAEAPPPVAPWPATITESLPATCACARLVAPCRTASCNPDGTCIERPLPASHTCTDGSACTVDDRCDGGSLGCVGQPIECIDGNVCTTDKCDPRLGCVFAADRNTSCEGDEPCTIARCEGGRCVHTPVACNDGDPCTADSCDPKLGCQHVAQQNWQQFTYNEWYGITESALAAAVYPDGGIVELGSYHLPAGGAASGSGWVDDFEWSDQSRWTLRRFGPDGASVWTIEDDLGELVWPAGVAAMSDGGAAVAGRVGTFAQQRVVLARYGADGKLAWKSEFPVIGPVPADVVRTDDGRFVLAGEHEDAGWLGGYGPDGQVLWHMDLAGESTRSLAALVALPGGVVAAVGTSMVPGKWPHCWLIQHDAEGASQWQADLAPSGACGCTDVVLSPDGGFALAGTAKAGTCGIPMLIRTDASGQLLWHQTYTGLTKSCVAARALTAALGGGYAIAAADGLLLRTNPAGNLLWHRQYPDLTMVKGSEQTLEAEFAAIAAHANGFYVAGTATGGEELEGSYRVWLDPAGDFCLTLYGD